MTNKITPSCIHIPEPLPQDEREQRINDIPSCIFIPGPQPQVERQRWHSNPISRGAKRMTGRLGRRSATQHDLTKSCRPSNTGSLISEDASRSPPSQPRRSSSDISLVELAKAL